MRLMTSALHPAGLSSQPHQGVAARFVHRIGGAVRGAIARLRRPAAPPLRRSPCVPEDLEAPIPSRRPRATRRPKAAQSAVPARPGWIARWFGLRPRRPALSRRTRSRSTGAIPFTPEACPQLSQEACDILNTPIDQLDPDILVLLFACLARHIADNMPSGSDLTDPQVVFSALWGRVAGALGHAAPGLGEQPDEAPAAPANAVPDAPLLPADELPEAQAPDLPNRAGVRARAASGTLPNAAVPWRPGFDRSRSPQRGWRWFFQRWHGFFRCGWKNWQRLLPPPPRLYYACAGPP